MRYQLVANFYNSSTYLNAFIWLGLKKYFFNFCIKIKPRFKTQAQ
nr:MAG TPA: hypothetical protein [Caudoviricetes sp.]